MRNLTRRALVMSAALVCLAALPREAAAHHGEPFIQIGTTRDGGFHLRFGHPHISHYGRHRRELERRDDRRLVAKRERLRRAAVRALRSGELRAARRLFTRAPRVEAGRRGYRESVWPTCDGDRARGRWRR